MKIQILMSTYNGSKYIRTQLDSIIAQNAEKKTLLIRDDGSTDDTVEIIEEYQAENPWISYYRGTNIGVQRSFLELISQADEDADYVALADQDDEWLPDKLSRAIRCLENMRIESGYPADMPLLYCSDKQIVGRDLEPLNVTVSRVVRKISFGNALVQNICTGCTAVMNRALINMIKKHPPLKPENIIMHDWWLYLTATCFGKVYYDQEAHIRYRQHGGNTSGAMLNHLGLIKYRLRQMTKPRGEIYRQVEEFERSYFVNVGEALRTADSQRAECWQESNILLKSKSCFMQRISMVFDKRFFRQKYSDDMIFRLILLLGKL